MQICMASNIAWGDVEMFDGRRDTQAMPKLARQQPKPKRKATKIRAWRKHRLKSLEKVAADLERMGYQISHGQLSRVERGESPYNQDLIEALANVLHCTERQLIDDDPPPGHDLFPRSDEERKQVGAFLKAIRTGTDG